MIFSPSASGGTGSSQQQVIVSIVSKPSQVLAGTNFQFKATVVGISGDQAVNWAVPTPNGGSIDTTGLYVAPTSGAFPMASDRHCILPGLIELMPHRRVSRSRKMASAVS